MKKLLSKVAYFSIIEIFSVQSKKAVSAQTVENSRKWLFQCLLYLAQIFGINMFVESYQILSYHIIITVFIYFLSGSESILSFRSILSLRSSLSL